VASAVPPAAAISAITATTIDGDGNRRSDFVNIVPPFLVTVWDGTTFVPPRTIRQSTC
jgi:hypothetical protein